MGNMMDKQEQDFRQLDEKEKLDGVSFMKKVAVDVNLYLGDAIRAANEKHQVSKETFWANLFYPSCAQDKKTNQVRKHYILELKNMRQDACPPDPYSKLDFQGSNKYLLFGGRREIPGPDGTISYAQDSLNYYEMFGLPYGPKNTPQKPAGPLGEYRSVLVDAIQFRNDLYAHDDKETIQGITLEKLFQWKEMLQELTDPLKRKEGWFAGTGKVSLKDYWEEMEEEFLRRFGRKPLSLQEVGQELFTTEQELTAAQLEALEEAVKWLNLESKNGWIYREERRELMEKLRYVPKVAQLLGSAAAQTPQEAQKRAVRQKPQRPQSAQPLPESLWEPISDEAARVLRRAGAVLTPQKQVLEALLDSFTLLVDESIFLAKEGRELLTEHLGPLLMKRHEKLVLDESVSATLFRMFRSSVPYTELELVQMRESMEDEEVEAMQQLRAQMHENSKTAIKTLRFLRERRCLDIAASPTDSVHSYENFYHLAYSFPKMRFLVLSLDGQLAEELKKAPGENAVVMKVGLDGGLLPLRATRKVFQTMLSGQPAPSSAAGAAPAAKLRSNPAQPAAPVLPVQGAEIRGGERVMVCQADGSRREVCLGKRLGEGGEGAIYETEQPGQVAKIYFPKQRDTGRRDKLARMLEHDPHIPGLCWPQAMVESKAGEWLGYLMPRAQGRELAMTVFHPGRDNSTLTALGWTRRSLALIAANIAGIFREMHQKGILMGDINPRNFLVGEDCSVYLVDCDSYQFEEFPCPVGTELYTPPEVHRAMKAANREHYGYIRTEDNERYSLAVLLFEILMLGKAPYESRNTNNQDVVDAIINGIFPYPYNKQREEGEEEKVYAQGGVKAPVGKWRQIWSNTTYRVKTGFYNTFTGESRLSAAEWEQILRDYAYQIELGHSSDALVPDGFKDTSGREGGGDQKMVDLVCEVCKKTFNLAEDVYQNRQERGEPTLCPTHWEIRKNMNQRRVSRKCGSCGKTFETSAWEWIQKTNSGEPLMCPACSQQDVVVVCSQCQRPYKEKRRKAMDMAQRGIAPMCPDCLPTVTCENCGRPFRIRRANLENRRWRGQPILCKKCRENQ